MARDSGSLQQRFADRCDELLRTMVNQARDRDPWKIYLAKGAGDRAIAGDHEQRHLLELLQNARDAIFRGHLQGIEEPGRVLVAVTEHGMAMANTGAPFRLDDEDVLEAVRFLMRSDKVGMGYIGHKGIGLKSILLRAGAFSVRTRLDGEVLRATFSRYRSARHLLDHIAAAPRDFPHREEIREELPRMPLFTQPHADADQNALGMDTALVESLINCSRAGLTGLDTSNAPAESTPYTTVVYLPYADEAWEQLLDDVDAQLPEGRRERFGRERAQMGTTRRPNPDSLWQEAMALDPRVFVLLGEIAEVQFVRLVDGRPVERRQINIAHPLSPLNDAESACRAITMGCSRRQASGSQTTDMWERSFVVLSSSAPPASVNGGLGKQDPQEHVRILLEIPDSRHVSLRNEPLFLYYPIDNSLSGLPFLIHGPFRVNNSRTQLAASEAAHNRRIIHQAVQLLEQRLPDLLHNGPLRAWVPWILMPQVSQDNDAWSSRDGIQRELITSVTALLSKTRCVPTMHGCARPMDVHFLPSHPEALALLEGLSHDAGSAADALCLLAPNSRTSFQSLQKARLSHWTQAAHAIGLGEMDRTQFIQALVTGIQRLTPHSPVPVDAKVARSFFLGLCAFLIDERGKVDRATASMLGQTNVPLLPAIRDYTHQEEADTSLLLVPTEKREIGSGELEKAGRVVFWQPPRGGSRTDDLPPPPTTIPVYFMDPAVVEIAPTQSILSQVGRTWGIARFEGRPDLFRRIADEAARTEGPETIDVLGYLAGLLQSICVMSPTGAADLEPQPYAAFDLATLRDLINVYHRSQSQRTLARQQLESLQAWARIPIPVHNREVEPASAHTVAFGPEWAELLETSEELLHADQEEEQDRPEIAWAEAIRALARYRKHIGCTADHADYPEVAPPDDPRWERAFRRLRDVMAKMTPEAEGTLPSRTQEQLALFRLLLLLGVRIGPRVSWRWLNRAPRAETFVPGTCAISKDVSWALYQGKEAPTGVVPKALLESKLLDAYRRHLSLRPYHPLFSGEHAQQCRREMARKGTVASHLAAWIWFPDLIGADLDEEPFGGDPAAIDAFCEALVAAWPSIADHVLWTGWYCDRWHSGRTWKERIPSLAAFQLMRLPLWPARTGGRIAVDGGRRFPAAVMVSWPKDEVPTATEPAAFLPMLDTLGEMARIGQDLKVSSLGNLDCNGAIHRLRWLMEESRVAPGPGQCWEIAELPETSRDAWLAAQYRLLSRVILERDPNVLWNRRSALGCGLVLRAAQGDKQWAVPITKAPNEKPRFSQDVAFFASTPRHWEREKHADKWILETQQRLETALHRWAKAFGARELPREEPPAYQGERVARPDAVRQLQDEVHPRMDLILGVLQAHRDGRLNETAEAIQQSLETLHPVDVRQAHTAEVGWSGRDEHGHLVFSIHDYDDERKQGRTGAAVLAEGIALLAERTTAVGELQHALSAPRDQVERLLRFRGVDLDAVIQQVTALAHKRLDLLLGRAGGLIRALGRALDRSVAVPEWHTATIGENDWIAAIHELKAGQGALADQALAAMREAAPDLPHSSAYDLLQASLSEDPSLQTEVTLARRLLRILRNAGWSTAARARFLEADFVSVPCDFAQNQKVSRFALNRVVIAALAGHLAAGTLRATEDPEDELSAQGQMLRDRLRALPTASTLDFLDSLRPYFGLALAFDPGDLLLVEWDVAVWHSLDEALCRAAETHFDEADEDWANLVELLRRCLETGTLTPLQEHHYQQLDQRQTRLRTIERGVQTGELVFSPDALSAFQIPSPLGDVTSETREPGRSGGGGRSPTVTVDQAVRGRLAELFVLEVCWRRFLSLDPDGREAILDTIAHHRSSGPGDVPWGTAVAWRGLKENLDAHRSALIGVSSEDDARSDLAQVFKGLVEVANERGPGFDVLDPFGTWGLDKGEAHAPQRVEIKAILPPEVSPVGHRVVLTTNEFHRARQHPESYVLRLIIVPRDSDDVGNVCWAGDIQNPVGVLNLEDQIVRGIRSGNLPLTLRW